MATLKILGVEAAIASDSTVGFANLVRVLNDSNATQLITIKAAPGGAVVGTVSLYAYECELINKLPAQSIIGASTTKAVAVSRG